MSDEALSEFAMRWPYPSLYLRAARLARRTYARRKRSLVESVYPEIAGKGRELLRPAHGACYEQHMRITLGGDGRRMRNRDAKNSRGATCP